MAVVVCPWCQSEIPQEEGQEPDKFCPVCDNELDGYRTLRFGLGDEDVYPDDEEDDDESGSYGAILSDEEEISLEQDDELQIKNEALMQYEETVEKLLDEQEVVPECPQCREYMLEAGETTVPAGGFQPRVPEALGVPILDAPFAMKIYVCPSCFNMQHSLSEGHRTALIQKLANAKTE
ncbi:hypothetical protein [Cohnella thailandensis]|uniref:Uncharacterized protein n=1 Tax=Cohnella thailandensis TaxID=557557 RepID=A0A841SVR0_9BACL|nr:hypothetical protein [Cohnella thailandensis]MBB6633707.1 hypothetical protein [Cohnella thailandensis]MBP1976492.1 rubrerythrin [Cohnella thailandensis]